MSTGSKCISPGLAQLKLAIVMIVDRNLAEIGSIALVIFLLAACAGDDRTSTPKSQAARAHTGQSGSQADAALAADGTRADGGAFTLSDASGAFVGALSTWPPADARCALRSDTRVKTFFDATGCACAVDSSALIRMGVTVGDYCADDPLKGYFASLQLPITSLPATAVYPAAERAWTRPTWANAPLGWGPQFARQRPVIFSPNADYRSDAGSGLAFFQVQVSHWAGGFDAAMKLHQTWSYWSGSQPLEQLFGADIEIQGRLAHVDAHTMRVSNISSQSGSGGFLDQFALELVVAIADGERLIALIGMIPLGDDHSHLDADPALVCELETIMASYRFEATPSEPTSVCDAAW